MPINNFKEDENQKDVVNIKTILRLFTYLTPHKKPVIKTLMLMCIVMLAELLNPYFLKTGIDNFIVNKNVKGLILLGFYMAGVNVISMLCARVRIMTMSRMTNEILLTIRQQLYSHIQKLSFSFFDNRPVGKILARVIGDVNSLSDLFSQSVTNLIPDFTTIAVTVIIMFLMNYRLALAALIMLPFMLASMFILKNVSRKRWQLYRKKNSNMNAFTHEDFSGIRVVQSFTAENNTSGTFHTLLHEHRNSFMSAVRVGDMFWPLVEICWGIGSIIIFWYGVRLLNTGTITVGLLVAFTGYLSIFWRPIMNISNFYNMLVTNISGAERIFEILDINPEIDSNDKGIVLPPIEGNVTFRSVSFGYAEDQSVLDDVSFHVKAGETIALVGPTGAGKTTIVNLISRFYDVREGAVLIDGYDVRDVTLESLRNQMGIMLQDTFLFSGTIKDNIHYGKLDATDDEILHAAKAVHAHDFIVRMENGYDTRVNERGARLSFGQRQLIAFARALLANPRILILDEATASIDTHTERLIQQGVTSLLSNRTSFVIAHRLSTIRNADRIFVIDQGKILEAGNHDELMKSKGLYHQLFMAQFKFLDEEKSNAG